MYLRSNGKLQLIAAFQSFKVEGLKQPLFAWITRQSGSSTRKIRSETRLLVDPNSFEYIFLLGLTGVQ